MLLIAWAAAEPGNEKAVNRRLELLVRLGRSSEALEFHRDHAAVIVDSEHTRRLCKMV